MPTFQQKQTCPCCGQTIKAARAKNTETPTDTAAMTDAQLYAYYKKTAPALDCAFIVARIPQLASMVPANPTKRDANAVAAAARRIMDPAKPVDEAAFWAYVRAQSKEWRNGVSGAEIERRRNREQDEEAA